MVVKKLLTKMGKDNKKLAKLAKKTEASNKEEEEKQQRDDELPNRLSLTMDAIPESHVVVNNVAPDTEPPAAPLSPNTPKERQVKEENPIEKKWKRLHQAYRDTFAHDDVKTARLVFLHPEEMSQHRHYTPEELARVAIRPFPSRLFITNVNIDVSCVVGCLE